MAPIKKKKKSKADRMDERAFSARISKNNVRISNIYNGDRMVLRNKSKLLIQNSIPGCYVSIKRSLAAESIQWLTRRGQSIRFNLPNEVQIEDERAIIVPHEAIDENVQPLQPLQQQEELVDAFDAGDAIDGNSIQSVDAEFTDSESSENATNPLQQEELVEAGMVDAVGDAVDGNSIQLLAIVPNKPINKLQRLQQEQQQQQHQLATQHPQPIQRKRRFSMAGGTFFSVNENTVEMGSDYLKKKPIETNIIASLGIQNNFDPFQRIANQPFALRGRTRSASQDGFKYSAVLESIPE